MKKRNEIRKTLQIIEGIDEDATFEEEYESGEFDDYVTRIGDLT